MFCVCYFFSNYFYLLFFLGRNRKIVKHICVYNMDMYPNKIFFKKRHIYL